MFLHFLSHQKGWPCRAAPSISSYACRASWHCMNDLLSADLHLPFSFSCAWDFKLVTLGTPQSPAKMRIARWWSAKEALRSSSRQWQQTRRRSRCRNRWESTETIFLVVPHTRILPPQTICRMYLLPSSYAFLKFQESDVADITGLQVQGLSEVC